MTRLYDKKPSTAQPAARIDDDRPASRKPRPTITPDQVDRILASDPHPSMLGIPEPGAPGTEHDPNSLHWGPSFGMAQEEASAGASAVPIAAAPTLTPDATAITLDADDTAQVTVRLAGASPTTPPRWSALLGDPAAVDLVDLSLAKTDNVVRVNLIDFNHTDARFQLDPQGPIGQRVAFFDCELEQDGRSAYVNTKQPVRIIVDSKLARAGRNLGDLESRRERGESVEENDRLYARSKVITEADRLAHIGDQPDQVITSVTQDIRAEVAKILHAELRGVRDATNVLTDALSSGPHTASMVTTFIEAGLLFASIFVPGGPQAHIAWKAITLAMKSARPAVKAVGAWLNYSSTAPRAGARRSAAEAVVGMSGLSGKDIVTALHRVMEKGMLGASEAIEGQVPVMLADMISVAPPSADGDMDAYRTGLLMAVRSALFGGALGADGRVDQDGVQVEAARDMHRMFLSGHARLEGATIVPVRGSAEHGKLVKTASGELGSNFVAGFGSTEFIGGQLGRAGADLDAHLDFDHDAAKAVLEQWSDETVLPASERTPRPQRLTGRASFPMVLYDRLPGRFQSLLEDQKLVTLVPEFDQQYYLGADDIAEVSSWSVELATDVDDVMGDPAVGTRRYSLRRVRLNLVGRRNPSRDGSLEPSTPSSFTLIYHLK